MFKRILHLFIIFSKYIYYINWILNKRIYKLYNFLICNVLYFFLNDDFFFCLLKTLNICISLLFYLFGNKYTTILIFIF